MTKVAIQEMNEEQAFDEADRLTNKLEYTNNHSKVFKGTHPEFGEVYIVIPLAGDSMILPIVLQSFAL